MRKNSKISFPQQTKEQPIPLPLPVPNLLTHDHTINKKELDETLSVQILESLPQDLSMNEIHSITLTNSNSESKQNMIATDQNLSNELGIAAVPHSLRLIPLPPAIPRYVPFAPPLPNASSRVKPNRKYRCFHWNPLRDLDVCFFLLFFSSLLLFSSVE
jgi:hypothetical protein